MLFLRSLRMHSTHLSDIKSVSPQVHGVVAGGLGIALTQAARGDDLRRLTARIQTLSKKDEDSLMAHAKAMLCEEAMACALLILHVSSAMLYRLSGRSLLIPNAACFDNRS